MAAIDFLIRSRAGPKVLRKAHRIERRKISRVCFHGKKNLISRFKNRSYCMTMVKPTRTPMHIPSKHEANTSSRAS